jgi:hypothetical protein
MAVAHLVTKGFPSVPFLVTQGLGDYGGDTPEPEPEPTPEATSTGGSSSWADFHHAQSQLRLRREREREELAITEAEQRKIDRAAAKIAAIAPPVTQGGLLDAPAVMAAPAFDRLLAALQPTEGQVMALVEAIMARLAWMQAEQDEEEAVIRLLMEMD